MREHAPSNITPTDIDYTVERHGLFAYFEMKTKGTEMGMGQRRYFDEKLRALVGRSYLYVVEHPPIEPVEIPTHVTRFSIEWAELDGTISKLDYPGHQFTAMYEWFFQLAESRRAQ